MQFRLQSKRLLYCLCSAFSNSFALLSVQCIFHCSKKCCHRLSAMHIPLQSTVFPFCSIFAFFVIQTVAMLSVLCSFLCDQMWLCNEQPSQATENPVGGKACSSTKGGLLRYIPNTHSIHKVSSLNFAYFQRRLSRHITSPSEKTRPESWPGDYMGKATPVWPPLPPNVTNSRAKPQQTLSMEKHAHPPRVVYCATYPTLTRFTKSRV